MNDKTCAEFFRLGLIGGLINLSEIAAWADSQIGIESENMDIFLELSFSKSNGQNETIFKLNNITGVLNKPELYLNLRQAIRKKYLEGNENWTELINQANQMVMEMDWDEEFKCEINNLHENLNLGIEGIYGTMEEIKNQFMEFINQN